MKIIQITDSHIKKHANALLYGVSVREQFEKVIKHLSTLKEDFDYFLLTGDIADDGSVEAYEYIANHLAYFNKKVFYINGNHDDKETMLKTFSQFPNFEYLNTLNVANFTLVGIDSCLKGKDYGFINENELLRIKTILSKLSTENRECILVLHHHPVAVNTPLIDDCPLDNSEEFLYLVNKFSCVKLILSGHVHNDYKIQINENCWFESSISTFIQFNKGGISETEMNSDIFGYKLISFKESNYFIKLITL
ncbi:metallophosphoesterase [Pigmentibacter sp. JX0631]|uniref:metallophosphoesterase n=1 Tax=Pigmentibacter sp. JX0631 TaxID=2976982 RepID=UPI002468957D|nr:metallophosphoesterase [Pigmentibacter sp. JX0631]WGL60782.1 metallophosphoesterase [Pigmentibacter sp. JX0631]